jgi:SRSO17 transposase
MSMALDTEIQATDSAVNVDGLAEFCQDLFYTFTRSDQRKWGEAYVRGLVIVPGRKTVRKISELTAGGGAEQCLQQFVNQSTWDWTAVRRDLARHLVREVRPKAWVIKEVIFPKNGTSSVGVARQFPQSSNRLINCQRGLAIFVVGDYECYPVNWRLLLPQSWAKDRTRRRSAHVPDDEAHVPQWRSMLDMIDEMITEWGLQPAPVVADIRSVKRMGPLLQGLEALGLHYLLRVPENRPAVTIDADLSTRRTLSFGEVIGSSLRRNGPWLRTWQVPPTLPGRSPLIVTSLPAEGSGCIHFPETYLAAVPQLPRRARPSRHVAAEWSSARQGAKSTWLTTVDMFSKPDMAELTTLGDRAGHHLDDLYANTGLLHFEGRSFAGWHHHVTLVSVARAWSHLFSAQSAL